MRNPQILHLDANSQSRLSLFAMARSESPLDLGKREYPSNPFTDPDSGIRRSYAEDAEACMNRELPFDLFEVKSAVAFLKARAYRVVYWTDRDDDFVIYEMPMRNRNGCPKSGELKQPFLFPKALFWSEIDKGSIVEILSKESSSAEQERSATPPSEELTPRQQQRALVLNRYLQLDIRYILLTNSWRKNMGELAVLAGLSTNTVTRIVLRFLEFGGNFASAICFDYKGGSIQRKVSKKLGRPSDVVRTGHSQERGINSSEHEELVKKYLLVRGRRRDISMQKQLDDFYTNFAFKKIVKEEKGTVSKEKYLVTERLSIHQFGRLIKKHTDLQELVRHLPGPKRNFKLRPLTGTAGDRIQFPGHTYLVDSTIADVYLVSAFNRSRIVGRPVVYVVIDAHSRLILSIYVALEGPNLASNRNALYLALSDKKDLLEYLDLAELAPGFRQGMQPLTIFCDRGELLSQEGRKLAHSINVSTSFAAPYRGDWKSIVERMFRVFNDEVIHFLPGAVVEYKRERGTEDYRLDACLTLYEFWRLMMLYAYEWNVSQSRHSSLKVAMLLEIVRGYPVDMWDWGARNLHGSPYYFPRDQLLKMMLPNEAVSVSRNGINLGRQRYVADWMIDDQKFIGVGLGQSHQANVVRTPENPTVLLCDTGNGDYRAMELSGYESPESPPTFTDICDLDAFKHFLGKVSQVEAQEVKDRVVEEARQIVEQAKSVTEEQLVDHSMSNSERTKGIRENRKKENSHGAVTAESTAPLSSESSIPTPDTQAPIAKKPLSDMTSIKRSLIADW